MCVFKDPLWFQDPKTLTGIIPQLYGDFSTYTPQRSPQMLVSQPPDAPRSCWREDMKRWSQQAVSSSALFLIRMHLMI